MQHAGPNPVLVTLITIVILLPLLYWRMRKLTRGTPLKLNRLWIRPALIVAVCALTLFGPQPGHAAPRVFSGMDWSWLALATVLGAIGGWQMGRTMAIEVHPQDGTLMVKGGQAAMAVIVVLVLVRVGLKTGLQLEGRALHLDVLLISDASIVLAAALFAARAAEMGLRAKKVMEQAKTLP